MEPELKSLIAWFCLGLFALAEVGNIQMGGEIGRMCALVGNPPSTSAAHEIGAICANRVPDENYVLRLEARHARKDQLERPFARAGLDD
jgi:hypothetical protein